MTALSVLTPKPALSSAWRRSSFFVELNSQTIPEWVQLIPSGEFATRDGRGPFKNSNPAQIIDFFESSWKMPIRFDYDHQSFTAGEKAGPVPASGWGLELEDRGDDGIWCRVDWTARAKELISAGEYKYLSPEFCHDPKTMEVMAIVGASLTNDPALYLKAIATLQRMNMKSPKEMYAAMLKDPTCAAKMREECGMSADSTDEEMMAMMFPEVDPAEEALEDPATEANETAEEENREGHMMGSFVPIETYQMLSSEVKAMKKQMQLAEATATKVRATASVDEAIKEGRIPPANREYFLRQAIKDLGEFEKFAASAPVIMPPKPQVPNGKPPSIGSEKGKTLIAAIPEKFRIKQETK
jgi:phage I-like protein